MPTYSIVSMSSAWCSGRRPANAAAADDHAAATPWFADGSSTSSNVTWPSSVRVDVDEPGVTTRPVAVQHLAGRAGDGAAHLDEHAVVDGDVAGELRRRHLLSCRW